MTAPRSVFLWMRYLTIVSPQLAGYGGVKGRVEKQDETKAYTGEIVSFDDIVWKT